MGAATIDIVTFDIDGTICVSDKITQGVVGNAMHRGAYTHAFQTVCGFEASIDEVPHHGMTDPLILIKVQVHRGLSHDTACSNLDALKQAMVEYAAAHPAVDSKHNGLVLLPGVKDLLEALHARENVHVGLVTGNLEPIAWSKMKALGIRHLFSEPPFGGFGSDFCGMDISKGAEDRAQLVRVAAERVGAAMPGVKVGRRVHIGDAPSDVSAAHIAGAVAIGVTTGVFDSEELRAAVPTCLVLPDLACTHTVLEVLGLSSAAPNGTSSTLAKYNT
eukprot:CAMPEP_0179417510 /NCGR_PEP_ID=MMETSP0799-20121207/7407_1 /TAXON_ID=46947 /ORGANISM="Geminigera cryophila, Strain CCMP2564" /LENGTH=274 /DNA_ID=CAMNT_0021190527 /DNA_START=75 /DNA_END=899 /DNA_ORIENTATION=-